MLMIVLIMNRNDDDAIDFIICYNHNICMINYCYHLLGLCTTDIAVQSLIGIYDRSYNGVVGNRDVKDGNKDGDDNGIENNNINNNPYRKYTIVNVLYCSGDVHGGNVTRSYRDKVGMMIESMIIQLVSYRSQHISIIILIINIILIIIIIIIILIIIPIIIIIIISLIIIIIIICIFAIITIIIIIITIINIIIINIIISIFLIMIIIIIITIINIIIILIIIITIITIIIINIIIRMVEELFRVVLRM